LSTSCATPSRCAPRGPWLPNSRLLTLPIKPPVLEAGAGLSGPGAGCGPAPWLAPGPLPPCARPLIIS
jgi:hypothetical protein